MTAQQALGNPQDVEGNSQGRSKSPRGGEEGDPKGREEAHVTATPKQEVPRPNLKSEMMTNPCNEREGSRIMKELEKPTSPRKEYSAHFSHPLMRARGTHKCIHFHMPANRIPRLTRAKQKIHNNSLSLVSTGCRIHSTLNRHSRYPTLHRNARLIHNSFS